MQIFSKLEGFFKTLLFVLYIIITQTWQLVGIIAIAVINNRPWECLFMLIGFFVGRKFLGNTYHAPTMTICTILTWVAFWFLTSGVPSFHVSITLPCIYGISLAYILSIIADLIERRANDEL